MTDPTPDPAPDQTPQKAGFRRTENIMITVMLTFTALMVIGILLAVVREKIEGRANPPAPTATPAAPR